MKELDCNDKLKFEGLYLNGKRNGLGRVYEYNNSLIYEGEFLYGNKHGKGKEYNLDGDLIFEGEFLYNYRVKGKAYINERLEYEGEYLFDRKYNGIGYDQNGNIIYDLKNGRGKVKEYDYYGNLLFEGEYLNGKKKMKW